MNKYDMILLSIACITVIPFAVVDLKKKTIPLKVSLAVLAAAFLVSGYSIVTGRRDVIHFCMSLMPGALLLLASFMTEEKVGYGDGIIFLIIGNLAGSFITSLVLFGTVMISAILSGTLLISKKATLQTKIPMIPFAAVSLLTALMLVIGIMMTEK